MFSSTCPIVLAGMNPVSDVNLAVACSNAGMTPTLCGFIYYRNGALNNELFEAGLKEYVVRASNSSVIPSLDGKDMKNTQTLDILTKYNIKFVELIEGVDQDSWPEIQKICKKSNITPIIKVLYHTEILDGFEVIMLKGGEGAGRGNKNMSLLETFETIKQLYPLIKIIVSGGIGTGAEVEQYIDRGAVAVAIGTLFAASEESSISLTAKQKIVDATIDNLVRLGKAQQNALVFSPVNNDDFNNTKSIRLGIKSGTDGHVFLGQAVNQVNKIESVAQILFNLLKGTRYEQNTSNVVAISFPYLQ
jgi:hypothetical protein